MTKLLQQAFEAASTLPEAAQNQLANELLQALEDEARWDSSFAASPEILEDLAAEALQEFRAGETEEIGFDEL